MSSAPEKIIILSFIDKQTYILDYDSNIYYNVEDFFLTEEVIEANLSINNCEYMIVSSEDFSLKFYL